MHLPVSELEPEVGRISGKGDQPSGAGVGREQHRVAVGVAGQHVDEVVLGPNPIGFFQRRQSLPAGAVRLAAVGNPHDEVSQPGVGGDHADVLHQMQIGLDGAGPLQFRRTHRHRRQSVQRSVGVAAGSESTEPAQHQQPGSLADPSRQARQVIRTEHAGRDVAQDVDVVFPPSKQLSRQPRRTTAGPGPDNVSLELDLLRRSQQLHAADFRAWPIDVGHPDASTTDTDQRSPTVVRLADLFGQPVGLNRNLEFSSLQRHKRQLDLANILVAGRGDASYR